MEHNITVLFSDSNSFMFFILSNILSCPSQLINLSNVSLIKTSNESIEILLLFKLLSDGILFFFSLLFSTFSFSFSFIIFILASISFFIIVFILSFSLLS